MGLAQVQAGRLGWVCWAGPSDTCYALHLAALQANFPPLWGTIYTLRPDDPADLIRQLRATRSNSTHFDPASAAGPGDQFARATTGMLSALPSPQTLTNLLWAISELAAQAARLSEYDGPSPWPDADVLTVTSDDLTAVSELAALGAELIPRGYLVHLTMITPACLTAGHPQTRRHQRIYADGEFLCWGEDRVPMCERWSVPAAQAAEEVEVRTILAIAYEHEHKTRRGESQ